MTDQTTQETTPKCIHCDRPLDPGEAEVFTICSPCWDVANAAKFSNPAETRARLLAIHEEGKAWRRPTPTVEGSGRTETMAAAINGIADYGWCWDGALTFTVNVVSRADAVRLDTLLKAATEAALSAEVPTPPASESEATRDSERLTLMEQWARRHSQESGYGENAATVETWEPQEGDDSSEAWSVMGPRCDGYSIMGQGSTLREAIDDAQKRGREEGAVNAEVDRG